MSRPLPGREGRTVDWGHWRISFWLDGRAQFSIYFPVGVCGPADGILGSPERQAFRDMCRAWVERGEVPAGAQCSVTEASLYDPECPEAIWLEGHGWTSAQRRGHSWVFPTLEELQRTGGWTRPEDIAAWQQARGLAGTQKVAER